MKYFFDTIETIPEGLGFSHFGPLHLAWLAGAALFAAVCVFLYRKSAPARRRHIRWLFAALLLADEAFKVACLLAGGNYRASYLRFRRHSAAIWWATLCWPVLFSRQCTACRAASDACAPAEYA